MYWKHYRANCSYVVEECLVHVEKSQSNCCFIDLVPIDCSWRCRSKPLLQYRGKLILLEGGQEIMTVGEAVWPTDEHESRRAVCICWWARSSGSWDRCWVGMLAEAGWWVEGMNARRWSDLELGNGSTIGFNWMMAEALTIMHCWLTKCLAVEWSELKWVEVSFWCWTRSISLCWHVCVVDTFCWYSVRTWGGGDVTTQGDGRSKSASICLFPLREVQ